MFRTLKPAAFALVALAASAASAQWGYSPRGPMYLHAPQGCSSHSFGYTAASRYSLYGTSYLGQSYAVPTYGYSSFYAPSPAPVYGVGPMMGGTPRGELKYDVYDPFGRRQEVEYEFRRDGSVRVDVDD